VATVTKTKTYTMAQLRAHKGSLFIKNNSGFLWTLHEKDVNLELKPATQPDSITYLPVEALDAPGVARNIAKGIITVSPDLEEEMLALINKDKTSETLLSQFQISVEESPQARAIDVSDQLNDNMARIERKRITPQGQQSPTGSVVDDFINPRPFRAEDGRMFDPSTNSFTTETTEDTSIKSVTVTAPRSL
jgi:hypothetical protein